MTTDNASNNNTFLANLKILCQKQNIVFDDKNHHIHCISHVINLAVQAALKFLKATASNSEDDFLLEEFTNHNSDKNTGNLLHKVVYFFIIFF